MSFVSKLPPALLAVALIVFLADDASAKPRQPRNPASVTEQAQTQPAPLPRQFFPEKGVQPLTPELEQALKAKDSFKECDVCPEMVVVPKGSFMMGTPANEPDRSQG